MRRYLRVYVPGGTYFFTVVMYRRQPILTSDAGRRCLRDAFRSVRSQWPWNVVALVLLPDHLHTVWTLSAGDADYSLRMQKIKERFTKAFLSTGGCEVTPTAAERRYGRRGIWQPRFWEHAVRDERDLKRCVDYAHWNPVKHGLVGRVVDYPWSSFHRYVRLGEYTADWGTCDPCSGFEMPE